METIGWFINPSSILVLEINLSAPSDQFLEFSMSDFDVCIFPCTSNLHFDLNKKQPMSKG